MALVLSAGYSQWSSFNHNHMSITVEADVQLTIRVLDMRARYINYAGNCAYKLYLNDGTLENYYEACATLHWEKEQVTFPPAQNTRTVDVVFDQTEVPDTAIVEGKLLLLIEGLQW